MLAELGLEEVVEGRKDLLLLLLSCEGIINCSSRQELGRSCSAEKNVLMSRSWCHLNGLVGDRWTLARSGHHQLLLRSLECRSSYLRLSELIISRISWSNIDVPIVSLRMMMDRKLD